ncbi:hypothetical protein [Rhizobium leguminosarum]|uniref:hypothetical protein n=1 Tax=Rhizobium leguminosarum TaxID=384 RepID=UPI003F9AA015
MLTELLKIGGVAALSIGVMYLLYSQLMKMQIFRQMTQRQTFIVAMTLAFLVFFVVVTALSSGGLISFNSIKIDGSSGVVTKQG